MGEFWKSATRGGVRQEGERSGRKTEYMD
jgi:hypothetical protein